MQKQLIESNVKTQEAAAEVVKSVKELISSLKEAGQAPEEDQIFKNINDINEKLNKILNQNLDMATKLDELINLLKSKPMEPPPQPSTWRRL
jgi:uncharacterized phage infection (PIP) family protein YhgE